MNEKTPDPILLNDQTEITVEKGYKIKVQPGTHVNVVASFIVNHPGFRFKHPNISATKREVLEFKHYRHDGHKRWTRHPGICFVLVIPRSKVFIVPVKGYSYIKGIINGVNVTFNVSGGGGGGDWTDFLGTTVSIGVNHPLRDLKRLADVAEKTELDTKPEDLTHWTELVAEYYVPSAILARSREKIPTRLALASGYSYGGETELDVEEACASTRTHWRKATPEDKKKHPDAEKIGERVQTGRLTVIIATSGRYSRVRVKRSQVDWLKTAQLNGLNEWGELCPCNPAPAVVGCSHNEHRTSNQEAVQAGV